MASTTVSPARPQRPPESKTKKEDDLAASAVTFDELCRLFLRLRKLTKPEAKYKHFLQFYNQWRANHPDASFYPIMRLMLPSLDKERRYGMKEANMAKAYVEVMSLATTRDTAGYSLIHWKEMGASKTKVAGDFPSVLESVLKDRTSLEYGTVTVKQINDWLDQLSAMDNHSADARKEWIKMVYQHCTAQEQMWLMRIVIKSDMKIGLGDKALFKLFHPDAWAVFCNSNSLESMCNLLRDPTKREHSQITLFEPFSPMLCGKGRLSTVVQIVKRIDGPFYIETKLDGERIQIHWSKSQDKFRYITRNGTNFTKFYGETSREGSLSPYLIRAIGSGIEDFIIDGEVLAYDPTISAFEAFGKLRAAALAETERMAREQNGLPVMDIDEPAFRTHCFPVLRVFDILYVNGTNVTNRTLEKRKELIPQVLANPIEKRVEIHPFETCHTVGDIVERLNEVVENNMEGLVIKDIKKPYITGSRGDPWTKLKPEYGDDMSDTIDVLIVGASHGRGERAGWYSSMLCAVRVDSQTEDEFYTFCRVGTGFTEDQLRMIREWKWIPYSPAAHPAWLNMRGKQFSAKIRPDFLICPEDSKIISVKTAQIVTSDEYSCGWTLRFPRFEEFREDLGLKDVIAAPDLRNFAAGQAQRRLVKVEGGVGRDGASVKRKATKKKAYTFADGYDVTIFNNMSPVSDLFQGKRFCVYPGTTDNDWEWCVKVRQYGGTLDMVAKSKRTDYTIADKETPRIQNIRVAQKNPIDVVRTQWVQDCIAAGHLIRLEPRYMFVATKSTESDFLEYMDEFGDDYAADLDTKNLERLLGSMNVPTYGNKRRRMRETIAILHEDYLGDLPTRVLDRVCCFVAPHPERDLTIQKLYELGAEVTEDICVAMTHLICPKEDGARWRRELLDIMPMAQYRQVISLEWIDACIAKGVYLNCENFQAT